MPSEQRTDLGSCFTADTLEITCDMLQLINLIRHKDTISDFSRLMQVGFRTPDAVVRLSILSLKSLQESCVKSLPLDWLDLRYNQPKFLHVPKIVIKVCRSSVYSSFSSHYCRGPYSRWEGCYTNVKVWSFIRAHSDAGDGKFWGNAFRDTDCWTQSTHEGTQSADVSVDLQLLWSLCAHLYAAIQSIELSLLWIDAYTTCTLY